MTSYKILVKAALSVVCAMSLSLTMGCPDKAADPSPTPSPPEVTLQMIYDEAAKGGNANLDNLNKMYIKKVTDKAAGDALIKIKPDGEHIICKLVQLPAAKEPREILVDLVTNKLTDATAAINEDCKNSKQSIDHMIDSARSVTGDTADDADDIIKTLVEKGDDKTVGRAGDKAKIEKVLGATKKKGDQALLTRVLKESTLKADMISWSAANVADAKVLPAMRGAALVTDDMVVTEAQKGAAANTTELKFLYDVAIDTNAKAAALAAKPAAAGDKFSNFLSIAPADANTAAVWTDLFAKIEANTNVGDVTLQVNLVGAGTTPIAAMLAAARAAAANDVADKKKEIIALMVEKGNGPTVQTANDQAKITMLFDAVLEKKPAVLAVAVGRANVVTVLRRDELVTWARLNRAAPGVEAALGAVITPTMVLAEAVAAAGNPLKIPNMKLLYDVRIRGDLVAGTKGNALATEAPQANKSFAHYLSELVPDAELVAIWTDYLTQVAAFGGAGNAAIIAQSRLDDAVATGAAIFPLNVVLAHAGLGAPAEAARNQIVKLLVEKDIAGLTANVTAGNVANLLTALRTEESQANFQASFTAALAVPLLKDNVITWAVTNQAADIEKAPVPKPTVKVSLTGLPAITPAIVLAEAAAAAGNALKIPNVKLLYDVGINGDLTGALGNGLATAAAIANLSFAHYLSVLAPDADLVTIWVDYLAQVAAHGGAGNAAIIATSRLDDGAATGAAVFPLNRVLALAGLGGPAATARNQIVKLLLEKDIAGLTADVTAGNVANLLTAMRNEESQVNFVTAFTRALGTAPLKDNVITWAAANQALDIEKEGMPKPTVKASLVPLVPATITPVIVVDEAKGAAADTVTAAGLHGGGLHAAALLKAQTRAANVKFLFELTVGSQATAATLAAEPPSIVAGGDNFSHSLAKLQATADTLKIWTDYLTYLAAGGGGGAADAIAQINLAGGNRPIGELIAARANYGDDADKLKEIIVLLVKKGDQATVRNAGDAPKKDKVLTAILEKGDEATMIDAFNKFKNSNANVNQLMAWVKAHDDEVGALGATVGVVFGKTEVKVSLASLTGGLAAITDADVNFLHGIYKRYILGAGARGVALVPAQNAAAVALEDWNTGGTYGAGNAGDGFIHYLVRLPATQITHDILADFKGQAIAGGTPDGTIKGRVDLNGHTPLQILTAGTAGAVRAAGDLVADDALLLAAMKLLTT